MTAKEVYESLGENFDDVIGRIGREEWIVKYLKKFVNDGYFAMLERSVTIKDWPEAFKMSHSMKGLAMNLGLEKLTQVSSDLCESLRSGEPAGDTDALFGLVKDEYLRAAEKIAELA